MQSKLNFRVKFKMTVKDMVYEGTEEEASWFLIDQRGNFYAHGPMRPITPIPDHSYDEIEPLIKVNDKYMTIEEIEAMEGKANG